MCSGSGPSCGWNTRTNICARCGRSLGRMLKNLAHGCSGVDGVVVRLGNDDEVGAGHHRGQPRTPGDIRNAKRW